MFMKMRRARFFAQDDSEGLRMTAKDSNLSVKNEKMDVVQATFCAWSKASARAQQGCETKS
jgi:hypothetical protein